MISMDVTSRGEIGWIRVLGLGCAPVASASASIAVCFLIIMVVDQAIQHRQESQERGDKEKNARG
jgi:hypothetical protein